MKRIATLSLVLFALVVAAPATFAAEKATGKACPTTLASDGSTTSTKKAGKKHVKKVAPKKADDKKADATK